MNLRLVASASTRAFRRTLDDVRTWYGFITDDEVDTRALSRTLEEIDELETVEDPTRAPVVRQ